MGGARVSRELMAVLLAVASALFIAVGIVVRQRSTIGVPDEHGVSAAMATALVRRPLWWAGTGVAIGGYVLQALALSRGSLLLVQPVLVSSLLFALPLSARLAHRRVTRNEWVWAVLLTVAIAVFVVMGNPRPGHARPPGLSWGLVAAVALPVVVGCVLGAARTLGRTRAVLLAVAVAVAILFGVVAVLTKASVLRLAHGGLPHLLSVPTPYVLAVVALAATVLQQSAFHAGALQASVPTMIVLEPLVAVTIGMTVLGEHLAVGGAGALALAVVVMLIATIALARDAAAHEEELIPPPAPVPR